MDCSAERSPDPDPVMEQGPRSRRAAAAINIVILRDVWRSFRQLRRGGSFDGATLDGVLNKRGLTRLFRIVSRSWHMLPIGFLFGLGFDTAIEVTLLGISAAEAAKDLPMSSVLCFPSCSRPA